MQTDYEKLLPTGIPSWQLPFWDSLREHGVKVQRCDDCGTYRYVPKEICWKCHSRAASWAPISGLGEVYTYTIVHRAPTPEFAADAPYAILHVTMDEGFRMIGTPQGIDLDAVRVGLPVQVAYDDVTPEWTLLRFIAR